jgi:hypothetical protein
VHPFHPSNEHHAVDDARPVGALLAMEDDLALHRRVQPWRRVVEVDERLRQSGAEEEIFKRVAAGRGHRLAFSADAELGAPAQESPLAARRRARALSTSGVWFLPVDAIDRRVRRRPDDRADRERAKRSGGDDGVDDVIGLIDDGDEGVDADIDLIDNDHDRVDDVHENFVIDDNRVDNVRENFVIDGDDVDDVVEILVIDGDRVDVVVEILANGAVAVGATGDVRRPRPSQSS